MSRFTRLTVWTILLLGLAAVRSAAQTSASMLITDPKFSFYRDPPQLYTLAIVGGQYRLLTISFNQFGVGFKVLQSTVTLGIPASGNLPESANRAGRRFGGESTTAPNLNGGVDLDPFPGEHDFDPDLWPDPDDDFPLPDPPWPEPDFPDEDPFDGIPDLPPFPDDDLPLIDFDKNDGIDSIDVIDNVELLGYSAHLDAGNSRQAVTTPRKIRVGLNPAAGAVTPDRKTLLVTNNGSGTISVVDLKSLSVVATIALPRGSAPDGIVLTKDGTTAYVTNFLPQGAAVFVIDIASRTVTATIPAEPFPPQVKLTPDGTQAWITSIFGNSVSIIDTLTSKQVGRQLVQGAWGIAFNRTGTRAYVASSQLGGNVTVIDTTTYKILATIPVGPFPRDVAVSPRGRHVFVTHPDANYLTQIDTRTNTVVRTITVGFQAGGLVFGH